MSERKPAAFSVRVRFLTCLILISMLSVSTPAAPEAIVGAVGRTWQEARFAVLSSGFPDNMTNVFAAFLKVGRTTRRQTPISHIRIFPGPLNLRQGQETVLSAIAYGV
ncbi:MAG: hypothetical protein ABI857_03775 [Acidobacteriota bacterium]